MKYIALIVLLMSSPLYSEEKLTINTGWYAPEKDLIEEILDEMFSRAGIAYKLQTMTNERSIRNANLGLDDGDAVRIYEIGKMFPNLHRVDEHFLVARFSVFFLKSTKQAQDLDKMIHAKIGVVNGTKIVEKFVKDKQFRSVDKMLNNEKALLALFNHEVEFLILNQSRGLSSIKKLHLEGLVIENKTELFRKKMYLHLHKKHKALIPPLEKIFKGMKKDGSFETILEKYLQKYPKERGLITEM